MAAADKALLFAAEHDEGVLESDHQDRHGAHRRRNRGARDLGISTPQPDGAEIHRELERPGGCSKVRSQNCYAITSFAWLAT
jgi:hypothetical protein